MSTNRSPALVSQKGDLSKADILRREVRRALTPPPRLSVDAWADEFRYLAKEAGSTGGRWETATVEVARGPMKAVTEPGVHVITVMCCTQLMKTALIENTFGYFSHLDPCPMLLLQPKEEAAIQFSKERITPLIKVTPVMRELIGTAKTRNADETLLFKAFPGGFLALAGAGSPDNLARRPIRVYLADEIDKYPVTREGDPIMLVEERTATFGLNWLGIRACSPTVEDESRIAQSYQDGDQRRASLECPHCQHRMFPDFFKHVEWDKRRDAAGKVVEHKTRTAQLYCESCGAGWSEGDRLRALRTVRWHQTKSFECCSRLQSPLDVYGRTWQEGDGAVEKIWDWWEDADEGRYAVYRAKCSECGTWPVDNKHASFQAGKLFSPWQKDKPSDIAEKWVRAKGNPDLEQAWWNTQMGLPHRPNSGKVLSLDALLARREKWVAQVPYGVGVLTVGADFQEDRGEFEVVGWGRDEESWQIDYHVIEGDPTTPEFWEKVDAYLNRIWIREDGRGFEIMAACLDTGHHTQHVYAYCKARLGRRIWAIKGESAQMGRRSPVWPTKRPTSRTKQSFRPVIVGVNAAKDTVRARLAIESHGPGFMHFPLDADSGYFQQLTAERLELKTVAGQSFRVWTLPSGRANEATDCRSYAYAALCGLLHFGLRLNQRTDEAQLAPVNPLPVPQVVDGEDIGPAVSVRVSGSKKSLASRLA